jgi:hypothetical protein
MLADRTRFALPALGVTAVLAAALAGCTVSGPVASGSPGTTPSASASPAVSAKILLAEHLVTQEGLAIALASNVLQTQLMLVQDASNDGPLTDCTAITGGGAHLVSGWAGSSDARELTETVYYDAGCSMPYLVATATVNTTGSGATAQATVAYTGVDGAQLGSLTTSANASFDGGQIHLEGTGTFTRAGAPPASLGLACQSVSHTLLNCQGGVAQDFAGLKQAVGSITPLQLTVGGDVSDPITFQGSGNSTAVAALGSLSIASPDAATLAIQGATPTAGTIATSGQAGGFVLFPATPTGWTVTDTADDVSFTINVVDNTTRALTATITQLSTKGVLATLQLDRSGTGTITYAGQKPAPVVSWMLSD